MQYAAIVDALRGDPTARPTTPFAYRALPAAAVAATGLDVRVGFFALNFGALVASGLALLAVLRAEGAPVGRALVLLVWYALLPTGLRFAVAYPVLVDGVAMLLFVSLLWAALAGRTAIFALVLVLAALTREHLVLLAPLAVTTGGRRGAVRLAAVALPAVVALAAARLAAPYPVAGTNQLVIIVSNALSILTNADGAVFRLAASPVVSLGVIASVVLARPDLTGAVLGRHRWAYATAVIVASGAVGGLDHDRFMLALAPFLMVAAARIPFGPIVAAALTALQVVATRALLPLDGTAAAYLAFALSSMPLDLLAPWSAIATASVIVGAWILRMSSMAGRSAWRRSPTGRGP